MFQPEDIKKQINRYTLSFNDNKLEQKYCQYYQSTYSKSNQLCLLTAIVLYSIFGIIDSMTGVKDLHSMNFLRYGFTIPTSIILFFLSFTIKNSNKFFLFYILSLCVFSISIVYVNLYAKQESYSIYLYGIIILNIYGQNFLRILFKQSFVILFIVLILFLIGIHYIGIRTNTEIISGTFFSTISFIVSSISAYFFEYADRKNFWNQQQLYRANIEYKELRNHLEDKVVKRTNELENTVKELETAKSKIEESNVIKSSFLSIISHEIRTPLTSILGFSQLIAKSNPQEGKNKEYIQAIEKSTGELLDITTKILTLSEIHENRLEQTSSNIECIGLKKQIEHIATEILQKRNKNLHFEFICNAPIQVELPIGNKELKMIFSLLLDNAVKYTASGIFGIECRRDDTNIFFKIFDTGIGISKENISKIFEYFTQENQENTREFSGIGVGLSICKGIVISCGGSIWIESEKNKGTDVFISLPIITNSK